MPLLLALTLLAAAPTASSADTPEPLDGPRSTRVHGVTAPVEAGLKGACLGGLCGACLGFGVPGMCVGGVLGWYLDELKAERSDLEEAREEQREAAEEARRTACEEARAKAPPGTEAAAVDCSNGRGGIPFREIALGVGGTALAGLVVALGLVSGMGVAALGAVVSSQVSAVQPALIAFGVGAGVMVLALVTANVLGAVLWVPYGLWFVKDQMAAME